jgi:tRNA(fMet)-specific endonuclease VapC
VLTVTLAEFIYGAAKSAYSAKTYAAQQEFLEPLATFPFDDAAAEHYGYIRARLEAAGILIGPND